VQLFSTTSSGVLKVSEFLNPMDYFYCNVLLSVSLLLQRESKFFLFTKHRPLENRTFSSFFHCVDCYRIEFTFR
jgi:hypothetical protein